MERDIQIGICKICNKEASIKSKIYHYDIICECCNASTDRHFEIVNHCADCTPVPPLIIKVMAKPMESVVGMGIREQMENSDTMPYSLLDMDKISNIIGDIKEGDAQMRGDK